MISNTPSLQRRLLLIGVASVLCLSARAFSTPSNTGGSGSSDTSFTLFDRFRPECPADLHSIGQFDPALLSIEPETDDAVWVAVFRSSNNAPSVFVKDEFFNAMRLATGATTESSNRNVAEGVVTSKKDNKEQQQEPDSIASQNRPVAVARLRPSEDFPGWTLDCMRCSLIKEKTDRACEGGSEHKEALSVAMDSLLLHHLSTHAKIAGSKETQQRVFEGAIRTKATLTGASLLEERGFQPIAELSKDMATHVSSLDACMEKYAEKYVQSMTARSPGARERAEKILSLLGRLDRDADFEAARQEVAEQAAAKKSNGSTDGDADDDYDPFAAFNRAQL